MVADETGALHLPWLARPLAEALQQPAHALLVCASPGVGALAFQLTLAQAWLCEGSASRPCGSCASCHLVQARTHPDLHILLPQALRVEMGWDVPEEGGDGAPGKRKPSRQIRIADVRNATDWLVKSTSRGRAKVLVLHPAEALNAQSANALLKTLEEPPAGVRMLLSCSDAERLLATVRSRCQRLLLPAPEPDVAQAWLRGQGVQESDVLLAACSGRPLDALDMARAGIGPEHWLALPRAVAAGRAEVLAGWPLARAIDALSKVCHDAMVGAVGGMPLYFPAQAMPGTANIGALIAWAETLRQAARFGEHPLNESLQIEALVSRARHAWPASPDAGRRFATLRP